MVVDPLLALIDLLFDTFEKHGLVSVCDIMQAVKMDELGVAEFRWSRPLRNELGHVFLHLFELGHLYQDLVHLVVREAFEELRAESLVKLLFRHAVLVQILQVLDPVLLILKIGDHGIVDAVCALGPGIFQQSFSVEVHLRLTATLSRLSIGDQVDTLQIDSRVVITDSSRINITIALERPWSLRLNGSMDLMRGSSSMWRSLLADGRGEALDLDVAIGVYLVYHRLLVELFLGGRIVTASLPHLVGGSCSRHRVCTLIAQAALGGQRQVLCACPMPGLHTLKEQPLHLISCCLVHSLKVVVFGRSKHLIHCDRFVLLAFQ